MYLTYNGDLLSIKRTGTNFSEIWIEIQSIWNIVWEMVAISFRPQRVKNTHQLLLLVL